MKGKHEICDSLVSSKLCDFVLKYLLISQSSLEWFPLSKWKYGVTFVEGKLYWQSPFQTISTYARTWWTCCFSMLFVLPGPSSFGSIQETGVRKRPLHYSVGDLFASKCKIKQKLCYKPPPALVPLGNIFGFVGILNDLQGNCFFLVICFTFYRVRIFYMVRNLIS